MTSISDQQQPTQNAPWAIPIAKDSRCVVDPAPAVHDEAERAPALLEAAGAERAELPQAGDRERGAHDQLGMRGQPGQGVDGGVDAAIEDPGREPEGAPDDEVAGQQERDQAPRSRPPADDRAERHDQRHARRQHHRDDHQHPAEGEQDRLDGQRRDCRPRGGGTGRRARPTRPSRLSQASAGQRDERSGEDRPVAPRVAEVGDREHRSIGSRQAAKLKWPWRAL